MKGLKKKTHETIQHLSFYAEAVSTMGRQFEEKVRELSTIRQIGDALAHSLEIENVCKMILNAALDGMGAEAGALILFEPLKRVPMVEVFSPADFPKGKDPFRPTDQMIAWVLDKKKLLIIGDTSKASPSFLDPRFPSASLMVLPLISRDFEIGVISLAHSERNAFRRDQIPAGHLISGQAAISLENVKLLHQLIRMNENLEEKVLQRTRSLQEANEKLIKIQDQLIQAEKMKVIGQLTAGIGHNLRTPLSVILSTADLIKLCSNGNEKVTQYAENIAQQGARMAQIIGTLMERCQTTHAREVERLNMNRILKEELNFMEGNLEFKHKVAKECEFDTGLPEIEGSYGDFSQTFVNLIENAVHAMHGSEVKRLRVCTRHDENYVYVDVHDTGCGIPKKDIEKIFDFSYTTKAPAPHGGSPSGIGIGLFNSRHLMSKYGAEIKVKSRPGATAFTVQIPLRQ